MPVTHKILQGEGAGDLLGFARAKLARLAAECERHRAPARTRRFVVHHGGGTFDIAVKVVGGQHYITIKRMPCPPFLSGLCDIQIPDYVVQVPDPTGGPDPVFALNRFFPSPASEDRAWRQDVALGRNTLAAQQMLTVRASMYTGEMRKVVQILQGTSQFIPYLSVYLFTHGVFTAASGQRWVIEISREGVGAWPMTMCRNPIRDRAGAVLLDYTPISTPKPFTTAAEREAAIASGAFVVLLDGAGVRDFYAKNPFYLDCSWAFNTDGSRAANVCFETLGSFVYSSLFTISIQAGDDGAPASATMVATEQGYVVGPKTVQMKYPAQLQLQSMDILPVAGSPPGPVNGPVYCYYDGMQLVTIRYIFEDWTQANTYSEGAAMCTLAGASDVCMSNVGRVLRDGTENTYALPHFEATGLPIAMETFFYDRSYATGQRTIGEFTGSEPAGNQTTAATIYYRAATTRTSTYFESLSVGSVMVVPWGDREAVYFGEVKARLTNPYTRFDDADGQAAFESDVGLGFIGRDVREICWLAPSLFCGDPAVQIAGVIGGRAYPYLPCPDGSPYVHFTPVTNKTYYAAGPGEQLQFKKNTPDCGVANPPDGNTLETRIGAGEAVAQVQTRETHFIFYASGGVVREFTPVDTYTWFIFADALWYNQGADVVRDAFAPLKYIATSELSFAAYGEGRGAGLFWTAVDYPIAETTGQLAFIGVP